MTVRDVIEAFQELSNQDAEVRILMPKGIFTQPDGRKERSAEGTIYESIGFTPKPDLVYIVVDPTTGEPYDH